MASTPRRVRGARHGDDPRVDSIAYPRDPYIARLSRRAATNVGLTVPDASVVRRRHAYAGGGQAGMIREKPRPFSERLEPLASSIKHL
jgi:hypothetical protein